MIARRTLLALPALLAARPLAAAAPLEVVATFSILGDLLASIGAGRIRVTTLVGPDQDLHEFQPRPSDAAAIARADLFVINGLGIEGWTDRMARAAKTKRPPVVASRGVKPLLGKEGGHRATDPHAWQDVRNVMIYVANLRDALAAADPAGADAYRAAAAAYLDRLGTLDAELHAAYAPIPRARRRVVTTHDALGYYGAAYGIDFFAPQGMSTEGEPSAKEFAALVGQIRRDHIRALFIENVSNSALLDQLARETGVRIGGTLYSDALSRPDGPAATYEAMMRHNTRLMAAALA